jgi:hypothetical protein
MRRALVLLSLLAACHSVERDPAVTESARVIAVFAPDAAEPCLSDLPFPTDLAKDPLTGLINVPFCETDTADQIGIKKGLRSLDGFPREGPLSFRFSGPINETTLARAITLTELDTGAQVHFSQQYFAGRNQTVLLTLDQPLEAGTRYVAAITDAITDLQGNTVIADQALTFLKSNQPLVDELGYSRFVALDDASANSLEAVRQSYAPVFAAAERATGFEKTRLPLVWSFTTTTQSFDDLAPLLQKAQAAGGAVPVHETALLAKDHLLLAAAGIATDAICSIHTGRVTAQSFVSRDGMFVVQQNGEPYRTQVAIDYLLAVPKHGTDCDNVAADDPIPSWNLEKVVVYAHGLGRCKTDAMALANALAAKGWATLSLDGPRAGARAANPLGDQDMDGCPDQPDTPELIVVGTGSPNPFILRDQLRQWSLELAQVVEKIRTQPSTFAGQLASPVTTTVALAGHSWGGIAATLAGGLVGSHAKAVAVSATPGGLGAVFAPLVLESTAAGLPNGSPPDEVALAAQTGITAFGWALEPADPILAAPAYPSPASALPVLVQVVDPGDEDVPLHGAADQLRLLEAFGRHSAGEGTFDLWQSFGGQRRNVCDEASLAVGSLLKPCVALDGDAAKLAVAVAAWAGMQRQLVEFIDRRVICSPDASVPCN